MRINTVLKFRLRQVSHLFKIESTSTHNAEKLRAKINIFCQTAKFFGDNLFFVPVFPHFSHFFFAVSNILITFADEI